MSLLQSLGGSSVVACSRAGCRSAAAWSIGWRNPKIHADDRVKVWVACDEHVDFLSDFLAARDFPLTVTAGPESVRAK